MLIKKLPGQYLYRIWKKLALVNKLEVIKQIADVLAQLCNLKFDSIGSLNANGEMGPLHKLTYSHEENGREPFDNTIDYFTSFLHSYERRREIIMEHYEKTEGLIVDFLRQNDKNPILQAPYRLTHPDFDGQNMLFEQIDADQPPQLTGIIDWDQSHSGLLYYLCEYSIFIQDSELETNLHSENRILRKKFVYRLSRQFPEGSQERLDIRVASGRRATNSMAFKTLS